jgi:hypothetical protein
VIATHAKCAKVWSENNILTATRKLAPAPTVMKNGVFVSPTEKISTVPPK